VYRSVHQRVPSQQGVPAPLRTGELAFVDNLLLLTFSLPQPCVPCVEPCAWACKHHRCSRKCYEPCNRPPVRMPSCPSRAESGLAAQCQEPCDRKLQCGHACVGLCGERCPPCAQPGCGGDRKEFFDDTMMASK
jgi:hypothetical protein